jgi:hypothetical protein
LLVYVARRLLSVVAVMVGVVALVFSVFYAFRPEQVADGTGYLHQSSTTSTASSCTSTSACPTSAG